MAFAIGLKAIRRLCEEQNTLAWYHAKLTPAFFKPNEVPVFEWVDAHVKAHHAMPQLATLESAWPQVGDNAAPEPASYYVKLIENEYYYKAINQANLQSQQILKDNKDAWAPALDVFKKTIQVVTQQQYRSQIMNFGLDAPDLILNAYHTVNNPQGISGFGWPYMDAMGGIAPGDIVSFIGRPQAGKSWMTLYTALHNWREKGHNVLFVSMEMGHLPIAQRLAAMIAGTNLTQLKQGGYSNIKVNGHKSTWAQFNESLYAVHTDAQNPDAPALYVVNGNLAANMEEIYALAAQMKCQTVLIDGAYLCRHTNPRLDRFTRAAENVELMKRFGEELAVGTVSSWQFNREAVKKGKGKGKDNGQPDTAGLEDIGYSDAIGQISSIVLGLFQDDGVEALNKKQVRVLKGRGGEVGDFEIHWDFDAMDFDQVGTHTQDTSHEYEPEAEPAFSDAFV